jgi:hypothetical protein
MTKIFDFNKICLFGILFSLGLAANTAQAEFRSRNRIGVGVTDNANLESTNTDSDSFLRLTSTNTLNDNNNTFGVRLGYTGYATQISNDTFSWRLFERYRPDSEGEKSNWTFEGALSGTHYPHGAPGTTDTSFEHYTLALGTGYERPLTEKVRVAVEPSYTLTQYPSLSQRIDNTLSGLVSLEVEASSNIMLDGRAELGFTSSSLSDYTSTFVEIGGGADFELSESWTAATGLSVKQTYFPDRLLSTTTTVTSRRGRRTTTTTSTAAGNDHEVYTMSTVFGELNYSMNSVTQVGTELDWSKQASRSGTQDYTVTEFLVKASLAF